MIARARTSLAISLAAALGACGETPSPPDSGLDAPSAIDAQTIDAPTIDAPREDAPRDAMVGGATLRGTIMRSTSSTLPIDPPPDGRGDIYVLLFESNPAVMPAPPVILSAMIENVDLSAPTLSVDYELPGIVARAEPYHLVVFLDDNENTTFAAPRPDAGDTVTMDGGHVPMVVIDTDTVHTFDVDMNLVLFFTP